MCAMIAVPVSIPPASHRVWPLPGSDFPPATTYNEGHMAGSDKVTRLQRVPLDERFIELVLPETVEDRIEAQELRQILHKALQKLTPGELEVIGLRHQHKKSPGQVAAKLGISREEVARLERSALEKLRKPLEAWYLEP